MCAVKERFVEKPNLPESKVTTAAVSGAYPEILEALKAHGIRCVTTEFDTRLPDPIAYHADMQMFHLDKGRTFVLRGEEALKKQLTDIGYQVAETAMTPEPKYPKDVLCNMLNLNGTVLANLGVMDPNIYTCLEDADLKMRHVNQGYTRCATAVVAKDAIITMDLGIRALAQFLGIDVLLVHEENVFLDGYDYGFLGGCCGLIDKNVVAFTGKLDSLECAAEIRAFLEKHCVQYIELTQNQMIDIGGILPLMELDA